MPALDLVELVDQKVAGALAEMNGQLEQLVAEAVDRELDRLVAGILEAELEGRTARARPHTATKTCIGCNDEKPPNAFEPGRRYCRECRREQKRGKQHRQKADADEEAHSPGAD